jgi:predicted transcriptional regulator
VKSKSNRKLSAGELDRVTQGNIVPLVAHLVDDRSLTRQELGELKQIIRDAEKRFKEEGAS